MKVIKRDGRVKDWNIGYIINAINKAYNEVYGRDVSCVELAVEIEKRVFSLGEPSIKIEKIQDIVLNVLKEHDKKVYLAYKDYREKRNLTRTAQSKRRAFYQNVLQCSNLTNDNANVDQMSFSGRKYRLADYEQQEYAKGELISEEGNKAIKDGLLYYHDLSSYPIGEFNCSFPRIHYLLSNGFKTRNSDVRPANSFSTACQLLAVIFQVQSQVQFGGTASLGLDWELEDFVHLSFVKKFKEGMFEKYQIDEVDIDDIHIDNEKLKKLYPLAYDYAIRHLEKEGKQSAQGLYHNLNTLESRAGKIDCRLV